MALLIEKLISSASFGHRRVFVITDVGCIQVPRETRHRLILLGCEIEAFESVFELLHILLFLRLSLATILPINPLVQPQ